MKIAYFVPYVPNLIRVRPYQLIAHLSALGAEVTVFTVTTNQGDVEDAKALKRLCHDVVREHQPAWRSYWQSLMALPTRQPLQSVYSWSPTLVERFFKSCDASSSFDVVHVEHLRGSMFGTAIRSRMPSLPVVWDSVDCISHLFELTSSESRSVFGRLISTLDLNRTRNWEGKLASAFHHVTITSQAEKEALLRLASDIPSAVTVLPNGVDMEYFCPGLEGQRDSESIVFSGKMSYHANISMADFLAREIMPKIWEKRPSVKLVIVGKDPPANITALQADPRITVTGTVADIRPYLQRATVAAVPLVYGAGIQNKILEAMACKTPVATNMKAMSALQAKPGEDVLVADTAEEFSREILSMIEDPLLQQRVGQAGLDYVRKHHDWTALAGKLIHIYEDAIQHATIRS